MRKFAMRPVAAAAVVLCSTLATALIPALASAASLETISLKRIGRYSTGIFDGGAAEIPAYHAASRQLFVVNATDSSIDVLDLTDPSAPTKAGAIAMAAYGNQANSVKVHGNILAAAIEAVDKQSPGVVALFDATTLAPLGQATVGALPDMLTFTPDGSTLLVANEGEPNADYSVDPEGSISVVDISNPASPVARTADFSAYNSQLATLTAAGVRIYGPNATVAQDLEPEYITVSANGQFAYVTVQEANALAVVNIAKAKVIDLLPLGYKDYSAAGNALDASDRDSAINIAKWPVYGMYQPDAIASYNAADGSGQYLVMANEGDARDYDTFAEEERIKDLSLDATAFPTAATLQADAAIGRLNVTSALGDTDSDGDFDALYTLGGRSFSIRRTDGTLVWDSGDDLEQIVAAANPASFSASNTDNSFDSRSDNKGPEPEGIALARINGHDYAFIGLERNGGVMVYDISVPTAPRFVEYVNPRDFTADPEVQLAEAGDLGPEGLVYIPADQAPEGRPLLVVANEVSGTTTVFQIIRSYK